MVDVVNGEDVYEVRAKTHIAMERARKERQPTLLEVDTYRYYGHSVADANAQKYRTPEEIKRYKTDHDPLRLWKQRLLDEGVMTEESAKEIEDAAKKEATDAVAFAEASPPPTVESIMEDVYWESDNNTESSKIGRHFFND